MVLGRVVPALGVDLGLRVLFAAAGNGRRQLVEEAGVLVVVGIVIATVVVLRRGTKCADKRVDQSSPEEVTALITGAKEFA